MNLNVLKDFYLHLRNTLVWFVVYFFIQAIIWLGLAALIWIYPQTLAILATIALVVLSVVSIYFGILFTRYACKLKKIKDIFSQF